MGMGCWPVVRSATARELAAEAQKKLRGGPIQGLDSTPSRTSCATEDQGKGSRARWRKKVVSGAGTPFMRGSDGALGMLPRRSLRV